MLRKHIQWRIDMNAKQIVDNLLGNEEILTVHKDVIPDLHQKPGFGKQFMGEPDPEGIHQRRVEKALTWFNKLSPKEQEFLRKEYEEQEKLSAPDFSETWETQFAQD